MFDVGFSELLVIAVVALLVLGPERLPKAARFAGLWVRKARAQWYSVKSEFERDLAADELQRSLRETRESLRAAEEQLRNSATSIRTQIEQGMDEATAAVTPAALEHARPDAEPAEPDDDDMRPMGSTLEMDDLEPPPPDDADEDDDHAPPPQPADDAHAGR
jgi:sec-independent protein translocase protein TatB